MSKSSKNKKINGGAIALVVSAMILGCLIVALVAGNKKKLTISGGSEDRSLENGYPSPSELVESDKTTYFPYMEIPDSVFNKMNKVSFNDDLPVKREDLRYLQVLYWGTDGTSHTGELIVNKAIAEDAQNIFYELYKSSYPIESIKLIDEYGGNDQVSMSYNNTSCFNGRKMTGSDSWSLHAYGLAIDINPLYNPYISSDGTVLPIKGEKYADRTLDFPMKITDNDYAYSVFTKYGFTWGGNFESVKDYQHFEKDLTE